MAGIRNQESVCVVASNNVNPKAKGFTLVELSIVLVIIGLIVSGIVAGQSLVKQAKIRRISTEADQYKAAVNTFYLEYNAVPGDFNRANSYWTGANSGDGDGKITGLTEGGYLWGHLVRAGLLNGGYTGVSIPTNEIPGVNTGLSAFSSSAGFHAFTFGVSNYWFYGTNAVYGKINVNVFGFGAVDSTVTTIQALSILNPQQAAALDKKFDDGSPSKGMILADLGYSAAPAYNCTSMGHYADSYVSGDNPVTYNLSSTSPQCRMMFLWNK